MDQRSTTRSVVSMTLLKDLMKEIAPPRRNSMEVTQQHDNEGVRGKNEDGATCGRLTPCRLTKNRSSFSRRSGSKASLSSSFSSSVEAALDSDSEKSGKSAATMTMVTDSETCLGPRLKLGTVGNVSGLELSSTPLASIVPRKASRENLSLTSLSSNGIERRRRSSRSTSTGSRRIQQQEGEDATSLVQQKVSRENLSLARHSTSQIERQRRPSRSSSTGSRARLRKGGDDANVLPRKASRENLNLTSHATNSIEWLRHPNRPTSRRSITRQQHEGQDATSLVPRKASRENLNLTSHSTDSIEQRRHPSRPTSRRSITRQQQDGEDATSCVPRRASRESLNLTSNSTHSIERRRRSSISTGPSGAHQITGLNSSRRQKSRGSGMSTTSSTGLRSLIDVLEGKHPASEGSVPNHSANATWNTGTGGEEASDGDCVKKLRSLPYGLHQSAHSAGDDEIHFHAIGNASWDFGALERHAFGGRKSMKLNVVQNSLLTTTDQVHVTTTQFGIPIVASLSDRQKEIMTSLVELEKEILAPTL
jgi:hypothetical protein